MNSPSEPAHPLPTAATQPDQLKRWLCELTHLSPQQVDALLNQRAQQQGQPSVPQALADCEDEASSSL